MESGMLVETLPLSQWGIFVLPFFILPNGEISQWTHRKLFRKNTESLLIYVDYIEGSHTVGEDKLISQRGKFIE